MTRIFIENLELDISKNLSNQITYAIDDIKNVDSKATPFTKTIILPGTANNNTLLGNIFEFNNSNLTDDTADNVNYNFNASRAAKCRIDVDGMPVIKGVFRLLEIIIDVKTVEYECAIFGELGGFIAKLGNSKLEDLDFSAYDHVYNTTNIVASWLNANAGAGYYYPLIDFGNYSTLKADWKIPTFRPALFLKEYLEKITEAATYTYELTWAGAPEEDRFARLIIPHNQKQLRYNSTDIASGERDTSYLALTNMFAGNIISVETFTGSAITANGAKQVFTYNDTPTITVTITSIITGDYFCNAGNIELYFDINGVRQSAFDRILVINGSTLH